MSHKGHEPEMETPAGSYGEESKMRGKGRSIHRTKKGSKRTKSRRSGKRS